MAITRDEDLEQQRDEDLVLQRASTSLLSSIKTALSNLLLKPEGKVHRWARERSLDRVINYIEPFQEDPQLLDAHLKFVLPPLVDAYLKYLPIAPLTVPKQGLVTLQHAICRIINTLCKVRGEKIITGFFNNEPRYLEPILNAFVKTTQDVGKQNSQQSAQATWDERYVLLLWISHLMLAPFDLATISSEGASVDANAPVKLPASTPGIAAQVVPICIRYLDSPTKERDAAALLLVRLALRPDMRKIGLLDAVISWALSLARFQSGKPIEGHQYNGLLSFLSRLITSANTDEIGNFIPGIYESCKRLVDDERYAFLTGSAIVRKFIIKIFRNLTILCLQWEDANLDAMSMLEEVIEYLLGRLADTDTPVRYAASKALSVIIQKLDPDMATEVIEAILGSLNENVFWEGTTRNLSAVDPLRWHGLTLTLGHVLYRRVPPTDQLPDVINALLLALHFEQRSTTGASIGTNVRDAASFGIWSLSRRYKTEELAAVDTTNIPSLALHDQKVGVTQMLAIELLVTACLDPAGNIRRGSSAALQELIGRHSNTVVEGITLVQTVDYHAVGLRSRAIMEVGFAAAKLNSLYWDALFEGVLGWRGVQAVDAASRQSSALLVGLLSTLKPFGELKNMVERITNQTNALPHREVEERHGLVLSLAAIADNFIDYNGRNKVPADSPLYRQFSDLVDLQDLWNILVNDLGFDDRHFTSSSLRPELSALAVCTMIDALARLTAQDNGFKSDPPRPEFPMDKIIHFLDLSMRRTEDSVLKVIPQTVIHLCKLDHFKERRNKLARSWLNSLIRMPRNAPRMSSTILALGAITQTIDGMFDTLQMDIVRALTSRCTTGAEVEVRVVALQALQYHLKHTFIAIPTFDPKGPARNMIGKALFTALNDYTINERGDMGSLVRLAALDAVDTAWWDKNLFRESNAFGLHSAVLRLSLEKLDKVRARAAAVLPHGALQPVYLISEVGFLLSNTSSEEYFSYQLDCFCRDYDDGEPKGWFRTALLEGYISSAGMGSEAVVQISRRMLIEFLDTEENVPVLCNTLLDIFTNNLGNDRIVLPLMEVVAFLLDADVVNSPSNKDFKWRKLLSLVQKAHYKSTVLQKLHLAIDIYRGLADIPATRADVLSKLCSMLLHPFPNVRVAAAETLFLVTVDEEMKVFDWGREPKDLKGVVEVVKKRVMVTGTG